MIGSLSSFSPGSLSSYGSAGSFSVATPQSLAGDGSAVCQSLECSVHGAMLKAQMQAQFPGLKVPGSSGVQPGQNQAGQDINRGISLRSGGGSALASGATLLTAQEAETAGSSSDGPKAPGQLSEEEKQQVAKLKQIDAKVRAHERAHAAAGGQYAGAPSYSYTRGPDGQMYATAGEVAIDISPEDDPQATLQKAAAVAAAALAPADPSGQDRAVAAAAQQLRLQALAQIREERRAEQEPAGPESAGQESAKQGSGNPAATDPAAPGQTAPGQTGATQANQPAGRDGPAARAAQAYGPAVDATRAGREIGRLVGLVA
ncbi:putative metalloprotease CJM1_0395 family protein [Ferrovibrio sp.]|uniref:putative metalloprotease CJM1_0395 family protein n=1 Tax=Ferrovibrio sp. TaxID=1917215 RepID=UPI00261CBDEB|nr:putative metalloprotease CJM1_0395 family protein [Ferrovibrio sp.]